MNIVLKAAFAACSLFVCCQPASAQMRPAVPIIDPEFLDESRDLAEDEIRFCINMDSELAPFDRDVATAIADALLLDVTFYDVESPFRRKPYDFRVPLDERELFAMITNNCSAFIGIRLSAGLMPEWLTISRPYFRSDVVFATTSETIRSFADIPPGEKVGSRLGAPGDVMFTSYLRTLPAGQRPQRVPYPDNGLLLERLRDGSVSTIMVWELAPHFAGGGDPASLGIRATFEAPFAMQPLDFGVAFLRHDTFLRGLIDEAIEALLADGTIAALLAQHGLAAAGEAAPS